MGTGQPNNSSKYKEHTAAILKKLPIDTFDRTTRISLLLQTAEERRGIDPRVAIVLVEEAIRLATDYELDKELANAQHSLGKIKWNNNKYEDAIGYFYQASSLREQIQDSFGIVDSDIQIGNIYLRQNYQKDAEYFYKKATELGQKINYKKGKIDGNIALANLLFEKGETEQAEIYMEVVLNLAKTMEYEEGEIRAFIVWGRQGLRTRDYEKAYANFSRALEKIRLLDDPYLLLEILPLTAMALRNKSNQQIKAEALIMESLALAKAMELPINELEGLTALAQLYEKNSSFEKAYLIGKQRFDLNQKITGANKDQSMAEVLVKYLGREKRVAELQSSNEILKNRHQISQLYLVSGSIFVGSIFMIGIILLYQLRKQAKINLLLEEANLLKEETNKELSETNSALERFAYVASHDLKEPLRTISSFTSLIARKYQPLLDDKGREYIKFVVNGVAHMNYLLEDLLQYSRLVNKKDFTPEPVNLNQVVASVEKVLGQKIGERNAQIKYPEMPIVCSNSLHMHQLFQNLIANGLKFNDKLIPKVEINCKEEENKYLISIKDNGIGIDKQYHHKIFEMFQRLSKNEYAGTGIGLAICQKIIELNEQEIWLESTLGQGTTFFFYLPKEQANKDGKTSYSFPSSSLLASA
ncbi:MAG: signal transduction histidine kinase [Polaribacter sp.]|jgi:signal transduction histidine kinase